MTTATATAKALSVVNSTLQDVEKEALDALWVRPIMVPLDGSALSERAIAWGLLLAKRRHSPLLLVRVEEPWSGGAAEVLMLDAVAAGAAAPDFDAIIAAATADLAQHAATLRARNP